MTTRVAVWLSGNIVGRVNEVALRRAGLVPRWVTVNQATQLNSAFHPSGGDKSSTGLLGWGEGGARKLPHDWLTAFIKMAQQLNVYQKQM